MDKLTAKKIAEQFGTPTYVFDLDILKTRIALLRQFLPKRARICYAMKANPFLIEPLNSQVDCFEVCSPGEFRICERNGIDMNKIVLSGVYKAQEDIERVMKTYNGGIYTVESYSQLELLNMTAEKCGKKPVLLLRITGGNQFGMDEEQIVDIISNRERFTSVEILGLQMYTGTQKKRMSHVEKELRRLDELTSRLKTEFDFTVREIEYGPGFYVPYFINEDDIDNAELMSEFSEILESMEYKGELTFEMGRFIAAPCGYYLTKIVDKKINREQNYLIVDGGINHLNYYGQSMAMKLPHYTELSDNAGTEEKWNICGSLCTVSDVLVKQLVLHSAEIGDILSFERVGAYSVTEGIYLFLSRDMPKIVFYDKSHGAVLKRDIISTDKINSYV